MTFDAVIPDAKRLLGAHLTTRRPGPESGEITPVTLRITEVEAYAGPDDPASHAYRGQTARNAAMFGPPGHAYVYRHMGLHVCFNVVVGEEGVAHAVLIRAGEIVEGAETAHARRVVKGVVRKPTDLAAGPARLTVALGITLDDTGAPLDGSAGILLEHRDPFPDSAISAGPRVGVGSAREVPARFWITGDPTVSRYQAAPLGKRRRSQPRR